LIQDPLTIVALIAGVTALAFWLDHRFLPLSKVGASLMVIMFGAVLSNSGLVPHDSPVYHGIEGPVTSLAIVYLLLGVRLADLRQAGPMMLGLFLVASVGTALGAVAGALVFSGDLGDATLAGGRRLHGHLHGRRRQLRRCGAWPGTAGLDLRGGLRGRQRDHGHLDGYHSRGAPVPGPPRTGEGTRWKTSAE